MPSVLALAGLLPTMWQLTFIAHLGIGHLACSQKGPQTVLEPFL